MWEFLIWSWKIGVYLVLVYEILILTRTKDQFERECKDKIIFPFKLISWAAIIYIILFGLYFSLGGFINLLQTKNIDIQNFAIDILTQKILPIVVTGLVILFAFVINFCGRNYLNKEFKKWHFPILLFSIILFDLWYIIYCIIFLISPYNFLWPHLIPLLITFIIMNAMIYFSICYIFKHKEIKLSFKQFMPFKPIILILILSLFCLIFIPDLYNKFPRIDYGDKVIESYLINKDCSSPNESYAIISYPINITRLGVYNWFPIKKDLVQLDNYTYFEKSRYSIMLNDKPLINDYDMIKSIRGKQNITSITETNDYFIFDYTSQFITDNITNIKFNGVKKINIGDEFSLEVTKDPIEICRDYGICSINISIKNKLQSPLNIEGYDLQDYRFITLNDNICKVDRIEGSYYGNNTYKIYQRCVSQDPCLWTQWPEFSIAIFRVDQILKLQLEMDKKSETKFRVFIQC